MAKGKTSKPSQFPQTIFINYRLSTEEKKLCEAWAKKESQNEDDLCHDVMSDNHKITFSYDGNNDTFICSFTGKAEDCNNAGKCVTSRGPSMKVALWANLYKHHIVFQKGVWEDSSDTSDWG